MALSLPPPDWMPFPQGPTGLPALGPQNFTMGGTGPTISPQAPIRPQGLLPGPAPQAPIDVAPEAAATGEEAAGGLGLRSLLGRAFLPVAGLTAANAIAGKDPDKPDQDPDMLYQAGQGWLEHSKDPNTSPAGAYASKWIGDLMQMPERIRTGIVGGFEKNFMHGQGDNENAPNEPAIDYNQRETDFNRSVAGAFGGDQSGAPEGTMDLGMSQLGPLTGKQYDMPSLPEPPHPDAHYKEVLDILNQMRPQMEDLSALDKQKSMAMLAGMAMGLAGNEHQNIGQMLMNMGLGSTAGLASIDAAKQQAVDKFKAATQEYLADSLKIHHDIALDDNEWEKEVWQTHMKQATENYANLQERIRAGYKLNQVHFGKNGEVFATDYDPTSGHLRLHTIQGAPATNAANMDSMLQGLGMKPAEAKVAAARVSSQNPEDQLPTMAIMGMKQNGTLEPFLKEVASIGPQNKKDVDTIRQVGAVPTILGGNKADQEKQADAQAEYLIRQKLKHDPHLMSKALHYSGLPGDWGTFYDMRVLGVTPNGRGQ